jgi:hypothetical protein
MHNRIVFITVTALLGLGVAALAAVVPALAGDGPLPPDVQEVRSAVAKYHSFGQAQADGYSVEGEACVASPAGTMGIHAINHELLDDPAIDPLEPEILLYVPKENGKLELVGVEYMRIAADQNPADGFDQSDKPSLFGRAFDGIMPGHAPWMGWHYDQHVWVAEENSSGLFALFNPALSC